MAPHNKFFKVFLCFFSWIFCGFHCNGHSIADSLQNTIQKNVDKQRTLYDYQTRVVAYKDLVESKCLLEILTNEESIIRLANFNRTGDSFKAFSSSNQLSKREIWRLAGTRISDFCRGFPTYLIQNTLPDSQTVSYIQNDLPIVEISTKKRKKRENRYNFVGRIRGQTQSQYLSFGKGNGEPGKAEAESSYEGTKAVVSGSSGMGQAQSQSSPADCGECLGTGFQDQGITYGRSPGIEGPERITRPELPSGPQGKHPATPGYPPGGLVPGQYPGTPEQYGSYARHPGVSGRPDQAQSYFPGARPSQEIPGYGPGIGKKAEEAGPGQPEQDRGYPPGGSGTFTRPGESIGSRLPGEARPGGYIRPGGESYAPEAEHRPGQIGDGNYFPAERMPASATRPGEEGGGYIPTGPSEPERPGTGARYSPGDARPGAGSAYHPGYGPEAHPATGEYYPIARPSDVHKPYLPAIDHLHPPAPGVSQVEYYPSIGPPEGGYIPETGPGSSRDQWSQPGRPSTGQGPPGTLQGYPPSTVPSPAPGQWLQPGRQQPTDPGTPAGTPGNLGIWQPGQGYYGGQYQKVPGGTGAGYQPGGLGSTDGAARYPQGSGRPGTFGGQLSGQYDSRAGHSGRFAGTFQGTYESNGHVGLSPQPEEAYGNYGPQSSYPGYGPGVQPPGYQIAHGGGAASVPEPGQGVPSGSQGRGVGGPGTPQGGDQRINGKWVPSEGQGQPTGGPGPAQGGGQWIDVQVPTASLGPTQGAGQWIDGKWVPLGIQATVGPGPTQGGGQWTDQTRIPSGVQVPTGGSGPTQGGGQWIDGKWIPLGVHPPTGGPGPIQGGGQWIDGKWVASGSQVQAGGQRIDDKWTQPEGQAGSFGTPQGGGQWIDGKWVPLGGQEQPGATAGGQRINGKWIPSEGGQGPGQWVNGKWVPSGGDYPAGGFPGQVAGGGTGDAYGGRAEVPPGQYVAGGRQGETSDDSDSQVQTSVLQGDNNETIASAQAQGKYQGGTSQSQVSGTYSGSGSFSASAGSDDGKRGAQTQVSGGKNGAQSSAQGRGGAGQSQAQVNLDPDSGDTLSSAQTSGIQHGTQTEVRADEKGGLADAQANGLGATSSQAQIGFTPYEEGEKDDQTTPFKGGGTAAAQSGSHAGMTQTQIQGKFRFGIRYQGAAQAGSGSTAIRNLTEPTGYFKPINFTAAKVSHNKQSQSQQTSLANNPGKRSETTTPEENLRQSETSREKLFEIQVQKLNPTPQEDKEVVVQGSDPTTPPPDYTIDSDEYVDPEYEDEEEEEPNPTHNPSRRNLVLPRNEMHQNNHKTANVVSQSSSHQKQHIVLDPLENLDVTIHQSKGDIMNDGMVLQPGQVIPGSSGFQIPAGFRGKVKSIANGPNTYAIGKHSQAQSVTLSPGNGRIFYNKPSSPVYGVVTRTISKNGNYGTGYAYQPINYPVAYRMKSGKVLPNFVSVSKSEAGEADLVSGKKTPNVYYTQSSSCGMFTNSCVYSNGKKTCFPVRKTNPDGTPMSC